MWNLKKWHSMDTKEGKERVGWIGIETNTQPCIEELTNETLLYSRGNATQHSEVF